MMQAKGSRWATGAATLGFVALAACSSSGGGGGSSSADGGIIVNTSNTSGTSTGGSTSSTSTSNSSKSSATSIASSTADAGAGDAGPTTGSCDIMNQGHECIDYISGFAPGQPVTDCAHRTGGTYSATAACDSGSSAGGCKQTFANGPVQTTWYYDPVTTAAVMGTCVADANAVYVAAP